MNRLPPGSEIRRKDRLFSVIEDPALESLSEAGHRKTMSRLFSENLPGSQTDCDVVSARVVKYRPGRRCTILYALAGNDRTVYVKLYYNQRGRGIMTRMRRLHAASNGRFRVPEPYAYMADYRMLITEGISGRPLVELEGDELVEMSRRTGEALSDLHSCGADLGKQWRLCDEVSVLTKSVSQLGEMRPDLSSLLLRLISMLWAAEPYTSLETAPLHRDLYPAQVIAQNDTVAFVDLDDSAMGDPLIDVANFLAHVSLLSYRKHGETGKLGKVREAFLEGYAQKEKDIDARTLGFYEASTLIRLAGLASRVERQKDESGALLQRAVGVASTVLF